MPNWVTAFLVLAVLVWVGMGIRAALALRASGAPSGRAWLAGLLAWPLVHRIARGYRPGDDTSPDAGHPSADR